MKRPQSKQNQLRFLQEHIEKEQQTIMELSKYQDMMKTRNQLELRTLMQQCNIVSEQSQTYTDRIQQYEEYLKNQYGDQISQFNKSLPSLISQKSDNGQNIHYFPKKTKKQQYIFIPNSIPNKTQTDNKLNMQLQKIRNAARQQALKQYSNKNMSSIPKPYLKSTQQTNLNILELNTRYSGKLHNTCQPYTIKNIINNHRKQTYNLIKQTRQLLNCIRNNTKLSINLQYL